MPNKEERHIIEACKKQDRKGQKLLYDKFLPYVATVCRRYLWNESDLNDALQECFILVFSNIATTYDPEKGELKSWIRRIAINSTLKFNQKYRKNEALEIIENIVNMKITPDVFYSFSNENLLKFVNKMPKSYADVFNLFVIDGYSHKEIADMLGINESFVPKKIV